MDGPIEDSPKATRVGPLKYLLTNIQGQAAITCKHNNPHPVQVTSYMTITLPCDCKLNTKHFTIISYEDNCHRLKQEVSVMYPINLPQLLQFKEIHTEEMQTTKFSSKSIPIIEPVDSTEFKVNPSIYLEPTKVHNTVTSFQTDLTDVIGLSCVFIWNTVITIMIIIMAIRLRKILLLGLIATPRIEGFVINPQQQPPEAASTPDDHLGNIVIIIAIMLAAWIIKNSPIWTYLKSPYSSNESSNLFIKIFTTKYTCIIKIGHIPLDERIQLTHTPSIRDFNITFKHIAPKLKLTWDKPLVYAIKDDIITLNYDDLVSTSFRNFIRLAQMKASSDIIFYSMHYMVKTDQVLRNLKLDYPNNQAN